MISEVKHDSGQLYLTVPISSEVKEVIVFNKDFVAASVSILGSAEIDVPLYDFPPGLIGYLDQIFMFCGGDVIIYKVIDELSSGTYLYSIILLRKKDT
jgi:hypothetical protein